MIKKWAGAFLLLFTLFFTQTLHIEAQATNILTFEELNIQVMPEFAFHPEDKKKDKPALLVGYHGTLMNKSDVLQKGKIEIPLPTNEKNFKIGFAADYNRDGTEMLEIEYEIDKKNGLISWETSEEIHPGELYKFVIEYYTDQIVVNDETKKLTYNYTNFADTGLVNITILEPLKSEDFKIVPTAEAHQQNPYGMNMFMYSLQGLAANEKKTFNIGYSRAENTPTMEIINEMVGDASSKGEATVKKNETLSTPLVAGVVGGSSILVGLLLILLLRKKKKVDKPTHSTDGHEEKKARLRSMLLEGQITEEEYKELMKRMGA